MNIKKQKDSNLHEIDQLSQPRFRVSYEEWMFPLRPLGSPVYRFRHTSRFGRR
ncbi:hypothetical protein vBSenS3_81 [Salmonella phage vB_SenS-3]|uniref:Uncharacterized protein n=1 Tax=Salmonella phage PMBT36 TaxID=3229746 RepID=A0AB39C1K8_9CAUD|nr:hypothetical protein vBSenS3_81 [Salmonella phage vB_SenS-3]